MDLQLTLLLAVGAGVAMVYLMIRDASRPRATAFRDPEPGAAAIHLLPHSRQALEQTNSSSDKTVRLNHVIDEMGFRTNVLALNAALEAACASER